MAVISNVYRHQAKIDKAILKAQRALRPDVVRIRYSFDDDWTGEPSIFFRIVISDAAGESKNLGEFSERVRDRLVNEVEPDDYGLHAHFNFRSESEQAELREPAWA